MTYQEKLALYLGYKGHNKTLANKLSRGPGAYNTPKLDSVLFKLGLYENTGTLEDIIKSVEKRNPSTADETGNVLADADLHDAGGADNGVEELPTVDEESAPVEPEPVDEESAPVEPEPVDEESAPVEPEPVDEESAPVEPVDDSKKKNKA